VGPLSVAVMDLIWKRSEHKGSDLLVLLAIGDNADEQTGIAYPGIDYLAAKTRLSPRGVKYAVQRLLEGDELNLLSRGGRRGERNLANTYQVQVQTLHKKPPKVQTRTSQGATGCTPTVSREPSDTKTDSSASPTPTCSDEVQSVWSHYETLFPEQASRGRGLTESKVRIIKTALKEYAAADLCRALDGLKRHREGPGKGRSVDIAAALKTNPKSGPLHEHIAFWIDFAENDAHPKAQGDDLDIKRVREEQGLD
jgi:hypothetical protein